MLSSGLRIGNALVTLPLALRTIPTQELGLYYTFLGFISLVQILDFGFGPTLARFASYAAAGATTFSSRGLPEITESQETNHNLLRELALSSRSLYLALCAVCLLLLLIPGTIYIADQIALAKLSSNLIGCWLVMSVACAVNIGASFWGFLLNGVGQVRTEQQVTFFSQIFGIVITGIALMLGWGIWSYAWALLLVGFGSRMAFRLFFLRATKMQTLSWREWGSLKVLGNLWPMAWRQGVVVVGAFLILRANTLICTTKLGLEETGRYGLTLLLLSTLAAIGFAPIMVALPRLNQFRIKQKTPQLIRLFGVRLYLGMALFLMLSIIAVLAGPAVLHFIGSKTSILSPGASLLLIAIIGLEQHHSFYACIVLSENENPFMIPAIISGIAVVIGAWFLAGIWGIMGILVAQAVVQLAFNNWWPIVRALQGLNLSFREFFRQVLSPSHSV